MMRIAAVFFCHHRRGRSAGSECGQWAPVFRQPSRAVPSSRCGAASCIWPASASPQPVRHSSACAPASVPGLWFRAVAVVRRIPPSGELREPLCPTTLFAFRWGRAHLSASRASGLCARSRDQGDQHHPIQAWLRYRSRAAALETRHRKKHKDCPLLTHGHEQIGLSDRPRGEGICDRGRSRADAAGRALS
jgi:hypothetical protein